jgi:hypothetical protein
MPDVQRVSEHQAATLVAREEGQREADDRPRERTLGRRNP